jgi:hypothetical protein
MKRTKRTFNAFDVCTGADEWYKKEGLLGACPLYQAKEEQCEAVAQKRLDQTLSKPGRCLFILMEFLRLAADDAARRNPDFYAVEEDECEDFNLVGLVKRLGGATLDRYKIRDWHNYKKKAADNAILLQLIARGAAVKNPKNPKCGDCKNISKKKPYSCLLTDEPVLKGTPACDRYSRFSAKRQGEPSAGDEEEDAPARDNKISVEVTPDQETMGRQASNPEELLLVDDLYQRADNALRERIRKAETEPEKDRFSEQYDLYLVRTELEEKGHSEEEVKSELLKLAGGRGNLESRWRRVKRYLAEVEDFLEKEVFQDYQELFNRFRRQKGGKAYD